MALNNQFENNAIDYGWRFNGEIVRVCKDRSLTIDESTHQMEKALRQMSMEYYALDRCLQCGICTNTCPNTLLKSDRMFSPRTFIQRARLGLLDLSGEELWECTHCGHCRMVCPFEIDFPEVTASLRSLVVEQGAGFVPVSIKGALSSLSSSGNPWKEDVTERSKWLSGLDLSKDAADQKTEIILFLGCLPGYDPRARKAAEAAMRLLQLAGISYEIMAAEEVCCGDTARRIGDFSTFERLKEKNKENLLRTGIKDIYALSPHCAESFQKFYGWDEESVRIHPILNIIHDAIHYGKIKAPKFPQQRVTFHDPCFFSKHMGIAEEPRDILDSIPGLERVEMEHSGRNSLCCGGGGGGIWRDTRKGERLAEVRLDEALASGAEVVVTACPYCLSMLEDARAGGNKYQKLAITDICELVWKGIIS